MVGATLAVALEVGLQVTRMGKGEPASRCHCNGGHHVGVNGTMVLESSWSCEYHHEGLILGDIVGCSECVGVTRDGVGSITGIGPDDLGSRLDCERRWLERVAPILLNHLHLDNGYWRG